MFDVFYDILSTLKRMEELMVKMEKHLNDLTLPPDMKEWSKRLKENDVGKIHDED